MENNNYDASTALSELMDEHGIPEPDTISNGKARWGNNQKYWLFVNEGTNDDGNKYIFGAFGDHSRERGNGKPFSVGYSFECSSGESCEITDRDSRLINKFTDEDDEQKLAGYENARLRAVSIVNSATGSPASNEYILKKQIKPWSALSAIVSNELIIPIYYRREIVNVQSINIEREPQKKFLPSGRIKKCYATVSSDTESDVMYICEGFATGASIAEAIGGGNVIAALSADNLPLIADEIAFGKIDNYCKHFFICADNDEKGKGIAAAKKAMRVFEEHELNASIVMPKITGMDFNDLHCLKGIEEVERTIKAFDDKSHDDLINADPPKYILHGIIPVDEVGIIYGGSTIGKSFFALDLSMRIMSRQFEGWNGFSIDRHVDIAYFTNEDCANDPIRYRAWLEANKEYDIEKSNIRIVNEAISLTDDSCLSRLKGYLLYNRNIKMVLFDTAAVYLGVDDENNNSEVKKAIVGIRNKICKPLGVSVILVCHTGKGDQSTIRGAQAYKDNVQFSFKLAFEGEDKVRYVSLDKVKNSNGDGKFYYEIEGYETGLTTRKGTKYTGGAIKWIENPNDDGDDEKKNGRPKTRHVKQAEYLKKMITEKSIRPTIDDSNNECYQLEKDEIVRYVMVSECIDINDKKGFSNTKKLWSGISGKSVKALFDAGLVENSEYGQKYLKLNQNFVDYFNGKIEI